MKAHGLSLSTLLVSLVLASTGCAAVTSLPTPTVAIYPATASVAPTASLSPTASLPPTPIPTLRPTLTYTPKPRKVDMGLAGLRLEDFPPGFEVLDEANQARLGLTPELLFHLFEGTFRQASPVNRFAFHTSEGGPFEVVIGVVFYPLMKPEQVELDHILADPESAMLNFSQGFGGQAQLAPEFSQVANAAVGWTFRSENGQARLQGEMVIFRRGEAAAIMMALYQADQKPPAGLATLAPRLDQRVNQGLGY